jgi:surfactin synthase thioesterase subunit
MMFVLALLASYMSVASGAYYGQRYLLYQPTHEDRDGKGRGPWQPFKDEDGKFIGYVKPIAKPRHVVIFYHGMGGEALNWHWYSKIVPDDVLIVLAEYPGYGARAGSPSQRSIYGSSLEIFDEVQKRWPLPTTIAGESLGSSVACYVASKRQAAKLALVSPFTSAVDVAQTHLPILPVRDMMKDQYPSLSLVASLNIPLHLIHGNDDEVVPIWMGRKLFNAYKGLEKTFTIVTGRDHYSINTAIVHSKKAAAFRNFIFDIKQPSS